MWVVRTWDSLECPYFPATNHTQESPDGSNAEWAEMAYSGSEYYSELKPFIVSGVSKRLHTGQRMHGYRLTFPHQQSEEENPVRSRRDTKTTTKGLRQGMDQNVYQQGKAIAYLGVPYAEKPMRQCKDCENWAFKRSRPLNFTSSNYLLNVRGWSGERGGEFLTRQSLSFSRATTTSRTHARRTCSASSAAARTVST